MAVCLKRDNDPLSRRVGANDGRLSDGLGSLSAYREHLRAVNRSIRVAPAPLTLIKNEAATNNGILKREQETTFLIKKEPIEREMPTLKRMSDVAFPEINSGEPLRASFPAVGPSKRYKKALDEVTNSPTIKRKIKPEPDAMFPYMDLQQKLNEVRAAIGARERELSDLLGGDSRGEWGNKDAMDRTCDEIDRLKQLESSYLGLHASGGVGQPEEMQSYPGYPTVQTEYYASGSSTLASSPFSNNYGYNAVPSGYGNQYDTSVVDQASFKTESYTSGSSTLASSPFCNNYGYNTVTSGYGNPYNYSPVMDHNVTSVNTENYAHGSSELALSHLHHYGNDAAASAPGGQYDYSSVLDQNMDHFLGHSHFNSFAAGTVAPAPNDVYKTDEDHYRRNRNFLALGTTQKMPDDMTTFLVEAGNAESFDGNESVDKALQELGLNSLFDKLPGMQVSLMPHQVMGVAWMVGKELGNLYGGCLADDMGLGKTVQMIATIVKNRSTDPTCKTTLVIAPVALLNQWKSEIEQKTNCGLSCLIYHGQTKPKTKEDLLKYDIVLTTHGTMSKQWLDNETETKKKAKASKNKDSFIPNDDAEMVNGSNGNKKRTHQAGLLFQVKFFRIVIDEGHLIRNRTTHVARAIDNLHATCRWVLTGTPIVNGLTDVYSYLRFLKIRPWNEWAVFSNEIASQEKSNPNLAIARIHQIMRTFLLRRKKDTKLDGKSLIDLPPKEIVTARLEFTAEEREIYSMVEAKTQAKFNRFLQEGTVLKNYHHVFSLLLRLRQVCSHPSLIQEDWAAFTDVDGMSKSELAKEVTRARRLVSSDFVDRMKAKFKQTALYRMDAENNSENATIEDEEQCPICNDVMTDAVLTSCEHIFCRDCILEVINHAPAEGDELAAHGPCPVCRADITTEQVFRRAAFEPSEKDLLGEASDDEEDEVMATRDPEDEYSPTKSKGKGKGKERDRSRRGVAVDSGEDDEDERMMNESDELEEKDVIFSGHSKKATDADGPIPTTSRFLPSTKMKFMMEQIEKLAATKPDEKILVVSQWTSCLSLVSEYLKEKRIPHVKYQGDMSRKDRDQAVRVFMSKEEARIMLMSLKCGGVGLNLTRANNVISLDLAWSMAVEAQAYDRVHRLGQTRNVVVHRVVIANTVEDRILERQERKQMLADGSLGEGNGQKSDKLSVQELSSLFGLDIRGNRL